MTFPILNDRTRATVLVVDDSTAILEALFELLQDQYDVIVAASGSEALELVASEHPDLVLLDVVMPGMDGYEVCSRLKASPETSDIPIIFLTGLNQEEDEAVGLEAGAIDYISKPFHPILVKARVRNHIEAKRSRDALKGLSFLDGLTGIPNRRRFDEFLTMEWVRGTRNRTPISLVMADVDHFKAYNDHYGHAAGDECLRRIARALTDAILRPVDLIARYGGEEFACVLPETDRAGALLVAQRIQEQIAACAIPHADSPVDSCVTLSLGIGCLLPGPEKLPEELILDADQCLYAAKRRGRNRLVDAFPAMGGLAADQRASVRLAAPETKGANLLPNFEFLPQRAVPLPVSQKGLILLVEDDKHMQTLMAARLEPIGARVEVVGGAREAMNFLARRTPDLILSDAVMPEMDGFTLCREVKGRSSLQSVPFVLLTSLTRNLRDRSAAVGADDFLSKLEDDVVFRVRIRSLLELGLGKGSNRAFPSEAKVLVVSPSTTIRAQLTAQLVPEGIQAIPCPGPTEALEWLRASACQVLILDMDLGEESLNLLLGTPQGTGKGRPVLVLANPMESDGLKDLESRIHDRLPKPLDAMETRHRVKLLLRLAQTRREA